MNRIFRPGLIFICAFIFVFGVGNLMACMCGKSSVCEAYNLAKAIVVAKVVNVKEAQVSLDTIFENGNPNEFEPGQEVTLVEIP